MPHGGSMALQVPQTVRNYSDEDSRNAKGEHDEVGSGVAEGANVDERNFAFEAHPEEDKYEIYRLQELIDRDCRDKAGRWSDVSG